MNSKVLCFVLLLITRSFAFQLRYAMKVSNLVKGARMTPDRSELLGESLQFYNSMRSCKDAYLAGHINSALDVLCDACRLYGLDNLLSSYNGGKDADVIMHLLRAVAAKLEHDTGIVHRPKLVYFVVEDEFAEVIEHIARTESQFDLDITRYDCGIVEVGSFSRSICLP